MPLLSNKFSIPKINVRKRSLSEKDKGETLQEDLSLKIPEDITFAAGDHNLLFDDGDWILDSEGASSASINGPRRDNSKQLEEKVQKLEKENNLLRIKIDVLMDILTETTAESHLQEKELQHLRKTSSKITKSYIK